MMNLLFFGSSNSCLSQMAEGFARQRAEECVHIASAGAKEGTLHPDVVRVMQDAGVDVSGQTATTLSASNSWDFDVVVEMTPEAARSCPILPGNPERVEWNVASPLDTDLTGDELRQALRTTRDEVKSLVDDFFERGYFSALVEARRCASLLLSNITDGIIAHDLNRRIFYFNKAAERITGYDANSVLNRDCHDVFAGRFCGNSCQFCGDSVPQDDIRMDEVEIARKDGENRTVALTMKRMVNHDDDFIGVLLSFHDITVERRLARRLNDVADFSGIIGRDHKMQEVFDLIKLLSDSNAPVLIQGESGTGKELVAAAIHNEGMRANELFVPVNCGALPESLLESELFGHVRGAFTGAIRDKKGRFELADGGTIFLDEIGDISPAMQIRLLRVIQEGTFERVGSEKTVQVDVRVISATNKDLSEEINKGLFREDLYYRLAVVPIWLPPLRERMNDIPLLISHILKTELARQDKPNVDVSQEALEVMLNYTWPGNVRELQNWIMFSLIKCGSGPITPSHLPPPRAPMQPHGKPVGLTKRRKRLDADSVRAALLRTNGNKADAARLLGVGRATLYRFLDSEEI